MKKILLSLSALVAFGTGVQAQAINVPESHNTLVMKATADWCGPCGSWGWTQTQALIDAHAAGTLRALTVATHTSSSTTASLNVSYSSTYRTNLDADYTGIPSFLVGNKNLNQGNTATVTAEVTSATAMAPTVNVGFMPKWKGDSLIVDIKTKFFKAATGEYWVGVFLLEHDITAYQNGQGATAKHHNIMRATPGQGAFGTKLSASTFTAGQEITGKVAFKADAVWNKAEIQVFTMVWKKNTTTNKYELENMNLVATYPAGVNNVSNIDVVKLYPNPASNNTTLYVNLTQPSDVAVNVTDAVGRVVYSSKVNMNAGRNLHNIETSNLPNGLYNVTILSDNGRMTERLSINK